MGVKGKRVGQVPVCNDAMIERLCTAVSVGMNFREAAQASGVSFRTFREWRARGRSEAEAGEETPFTKLVAGMEVAEARFEETHLKRIVAAGTKDTVTTVVTEKVVRGEPVTETRTTITPPLWTPSAWLLERTRPERYALINRIETGAPGAFDSLGDSELTAEILKLVPKRHPKRKDGEEDGIAADAETA